MPDIMLEAAQKYARRGIATFPISPLSKVPIKGSNGVKDASTAADVLEAMFNSVPDCNIAIATGAPSGLFVIDIDIKHNLGKYGDDSLEALIKELGPLPDTWECQTPSGGRHIYFKLPDGVTILNSAGQLAPSIDIRGSGGYVVAPPSKLNDSSGQAARYEWEAASQPVDTPLADIPDAWLKRILDTQRGGKGGSHGGDRFKLPDIIPEGERNPTLFHYGASMRTHCTAPTELHDALHRANRERCRPPLDDKEVDGIYNSVMRYAEGKSPEYSRSTAKSDFVDGDYTGGMDWTPDKRPADGGAEPLADQGGTEGDKQPERREYIAKSAADFPDEQIEFLWYPYIPRGEYTLLAAAGGTGKTMLCCLIASAVSNGDPLFGDDRNDFHDKEKVLIISAEDSGATLKRRLKNSGANLDFIRIVDCIDSTGLCFSGPGYNEFADLIRREQPSLIILDPYFAFIDSRVDLNRINQVRPELQRLAVLAKEINAAFVLISHVNKRAQGENLNNAATGTADIINAARSALSIQYVKDSRRVMIHTKSNHAKRGQSIEYEITDDGGVRIVGFSDIDKEMVELAARSHKSLTELLEAREREKSIDTSILIDALLDICPPDGRRLNISYDDMIDRYGEDVFLGETQPKKALERIQLQTSFYNFEIDDIGKRVKVKVDGATTTKRGFSIRLINVPDPEQQSLDLESDVE